jgi:hypothetical protein
VTLFSLLLFTHVLGAIIAFGPTFSGPIIGRIGAQNPAHGNFAMRVSKELARVQILPLAIVQGFTGLGLIIVGDVDVMKSTWLLVSIVLYLVAIGYAVFVQTPLAKRIIVMTTPPRVPRPRWRGGGHRQAAGNDQAGQARQLLLMAS